MGLKKLFAIPGQLQSHQHHNYKNLLQACRIVWFRVFKINVFSFPFKILSVRTYNYDQYEFL